MKLKMLVFVLLIALSTATANRYFISAPNVFHVDTPVNVSIVVSGVTSPVTVELYLQFKDYRNRRKTFSQVKADFTSDIPGFLTVKVSPADVNIGSLYEKYVYLVAKCNHAQLSFQKEAKILLGFRNGIILIQTDKPIYTPKQTVYIRVVPLDFNLYPSTRKLTIMVKNPQGIRVQQWKDLNTDTGFISKTDLHLGHFAIKGNWTVEAYYDGMFIHNTSTVFEVREYVLPKFSVTIEGPDHILPNKKKFHIIVRARYTYGKPVFGFASIRVKIAGFGQVPLMITSFRQIMKDGVLEFPIKRQDIKFWFPEGHRLEIEAAITERSTGITERAFDNSIIFTTSPYRIKFTNTARYFRPGMPFPIKVRVTSTSKKPQADTPMKITAEWTEIDGTPFKLGDSKLRFKDNTANKGITDSDGIAEFIIDMPRDLDANRLKIKVETNVPSSIYNGAKDYFAERSTSPSGDYLMIRQLKSAQVGDYVQCEAIISNVKKVNCNWLAYMVIARGQIVYQTVKKQDCQQIKTIRFMATSVMSPKSRIVAYYMLDSGEVISDVTSLEISDSLPNKIAIKDSKDGFLNKLPAELYTLQVLGTKGTRIALLAVDQSVYLLRNKNRLTPTSVLEKVEELDLGCGAGGGKDTADIFKNSGLSVITESLVSSERRDFTCRDDRFKRKKRSIGRDPTVDCCRLGNATDSRHCIRRMQDLEYPFYKDDPITYSQCILSFMKCCVARYGAKDMGLLARSGLDEDFQFSADEVAETQVRSNFPEKWLFEEIIINDDVKVAVCKKYLQRTTCHAASLNATVPDTITTFIVQAIAVSNQSGFGIAQPLNLRIIKPVFVTLKMPCSAQRGEQITILATVFNYQPTKTKVHIYLTADKGFCSTANTGDSTTQMTKKRLMVNENGGSVSFPITIVPINYGPVSVPVKVYASNGDQYDAVERKLLVVPEGIEIRKSQTFILDPQGLLKDSRLAGEKNDVKEKNETFKSQRILNIPGSKQIDKVFIDVPKESISESVNALISFTGNLIAPKLIAGGLGSMLKLPCGCGEQNMVKLAPDVYVLQYLYNTNQVTENVKALINGHIKTGYMNELDYRHKDHSYSASKGDISGSTWLTAFVVKVFCEAKQFDGVRDHIDENAICQSVDWLLKNQHANGAIPELFRVRNRGMVGGVYKYGDIAITAFVVTALMECQCNAMVNTEAITRAVGYLENNLDTMTDAYTTAMTTYTLALANSPQRHRANAKLTQQALYDPATNSRHWNVSGYALKIETTAYALLAQIALNRLKYAGPIVTWLTKQKNSGGGFKSTTDTCVALQALAKYSEKTSKTKLDLQISVLPINSTKNVYHSKLLLINKDNAFMQQSVDILPYLRQDESVFEITTVGSGIAQMQFDLKYNLAATKEEKCAFMIEFSITKVGNGLEIPQNDPPAAPPKRRKRNSKRTGKRKGRRKKNRRNKNKKNRNKKNRNKNKKNKGKKNKNKKRKKKKPKTAPAPRELVITICTQYKKQGNTGMAIVDVGILTGYEVDEDSVKKLMAKMNDTISNYEISEAALVLYVDSISSANKVCFGLKMKRVFDMGAVYPVPIKVYDYYEPDDSCTKYYSLGGGTTLIGSCNTDGESCRCTQDKCAVVNPNMKDHDKMVQRICHEYDFAITGTVLIVDEKGLGDWLSYKIRVDLVIKQGNKDITKDDEITFSKRGTCLNPILNQGKEVLILGRDKAGRYTIDYSTLVADIAGLSGDVAALETRIIDRNECARI